MKFNLFRPALLISIFILQSQLKGQEIFTNSDHEAYKDDTIILYCTKYRGEIQWEISRDLQNWFELVGEKKDTLTYFADSSIFVRARITENTCSPVYSDPLSLKVIEKRTLKFPVSSLSGNIALLDTNGPLENLRFWYKENTFNTGDTLEIRYYIDNQNIIDSLFSKLGPVIEIYYRGQQDSLKNPVRIEIPIANWSLQEPKIPIIGHFIDSTHTWEIVKIDEITDSSIIFHINHFSKIGAFLLNLPSVVYNAFINEVAATQIYEDFIFEIEQFRCNSIQDLLVQLENLKKSSYDYMESLNPENCDGLCLGTNDFLLNIDQYVSGAFISQVITSKAFLGYVGLTGGAATAITILGGASAILFTPCLLCIMYNSTINPAFWTSYADYFMAEWGIEYLKLFEEKYCNYQLETDDFTDSRDGHTYNIVKIGDQWWMAENLSYLPSVSPSGAWSETEQVYYVNGYEGSDIIYAKSTSNYKNYGVLYNWEAARNACPAGWSLPNAKEWSQLEQTIGMSSSESGTFGRFRGTDEGLKLKSVKGWDNDGNGTNYYGFNALPGGSRSNANFFIKTGYVGSWWSGTTYGGYNKAFHYSLRYDEGGVYMNNSYIDNGYSVRCVISLVPAADFTASYTSITAGEEVQFTDLTTNDPTTWLWNFGDNVYSTEKNPVHIFSKPGVYTITLKAINKYGDDTETKNAYIEVKPEVSTFMDTRDNTVYKTVKIGNQWWMAENLAYLPAVNPASQGSISIPNYYVYDYQGDNVPDAKSASNYAIYGVLYNWSAAINACPNGWHLPTDQEWGILEVFLGMNESLISEFGFRGYGLITGTLMKSTTGWAFEGNGTDLFGFTALPGGQRDPASVFNGKGEGGFWWSSSEFSTNSALIRMLYGWEKSSGRVDAMKDSGFSLRCVKD